MYVVECYTRRTAETTIVDEVDYLVAIHFDPYRHSDPLGSRMAFGELEEAFQFHTLAAAEVGAVMVGGTVKSLDADGKLSTVTSNGHAN